MADTLTAAGRAEADEIGRRHDVPADAVATLLAAIRRGGGRQAQFSHPALGGMGQWSRGGGIMIGDMFNHSLKAKVEQLCSALAERIDEDGLFATGPGVSNDWWPDDLGRPSSAGSQNDQAYACFPEKRRLAVRDTDGVRIYDTGDHRISGVSQQQGSGRDLTFSDQHGAVRLSDLEPVDGGVKAKAPARSEEGRASGRSKDDEKPGRGPDAAAVTPPKVGADGDVLDLLERLHELQRKGILTAEEFSAKKTDLLARL